MSLKWPGKDYYNPSFASLSGCSRGKGMERDREQGAGRERKGEGEREGDVYRYYYDHTPPYSFCTLPLVV
tara:strand:- start:448 stop:657 length:210 start_codon:yes stop_codon:yes gene_type:complete